MDPWKLLGVALDGRCHRTAVDFGEDVCKNKLSGSQQAADLWNPAVRSPSAQQNPMAEGCVNVYIHVHTHISP